jgi:hypothetical protein
MPGYPHWNVNWVGDRIVLRLPGRGLCPVGRDSGGRIAGAHGQELAAQPAGKNAS